MRFIAFTDNHGNPISREDAASTLGRGIMASQGFASEPPAGSPPPAPQGTGLIPELSPPAPPPAGQGTGLITELRRA